MFGKVGSTFWEHNPGSEGRLPRVNAFLPTVTTEQAAGAIAKSIKDKAFEVVRPRMFRYIFFLNFFFPGTTERVMRTGWKAALPPRRKGLTAQAEPENRRFDASWELLYNKGVLTPEGWPSG
jgi:hypothetical protein